MMKILLLLLWAFQLQMAEDHPGCHLAFKLSWLIPRHLTVKTYRKPLWSCWDDTHRQRANCSFSTNSRMVSCVFGFINASSDLGCFDAGDGCGALAENCVFLSSCWLCHGSHLLSEWEGCKGKSILTTRDTPAKPGETFGFGTPPWHRTPWQRTRRGWRRQGVGAARPCGFCTTPWQGTPRRGWRRWGVGAARPAARPRETC